MIEMPKTEPLSKSYTAFGGERRVASGRLEDVVLRVKEVLEGGEREPVLVFDDVTSQQVEVDFRGSRQEVLTRLGCRAGQEEAPFAPDGTPRGPGRPKLGVVGREVTLLPRHWDWLNSQPGGPSVTLRKLVEEAKRANVGKDRVRAARDAAYEFMRVMAGDRPGFEEATRILFSKGKDRLTGLQSLLAHWPDDIREHTLGLAKLTFELDESLPRATTSTTA